VTSEHFEGKSTLEHLRIARAKGAYAMAEIHGTEMPGHLSACADSIKETALIGLLLWIVLPFFGIEHKPLILFLSLFTFGFFFWKVGRSALLGWSRLTRLHRVIEEERFEIEHHREQEREELSELYRAKGFSGKLLEEVINVLMADDNRLLLVMLEEEMGLKLESYEHPLKQSCGAGIGVLISALFLLGPAFLSPMGVPCAAALLFIGASLLACRAEGNRILTTIIWNCALALLSASLVYLISQAIRG